MTVKELIIKLGEFDENIQVGGTDHFGSFLPVEYVELNKQEGRYYRTEEGDVKVPPFVQISIEWAGNEPD